MMASATPTVSLKNVSVPNALPAFMDSLVGLPNDPASLYISVDKHSLIIYDEPASTINLIDLSQLNVALCQGDESASALKTLLETGPTIKVFFDARVPAKTLFERCSIKLATETYARQTYIHEVQMMEVAVRREDANHEWLASFDKCIRQDSDLVGGELTSGDLYGNLRFDERILHLPFLWRKYHGRMTEQRGFGESTGFWVAMVRGATRERLQGSHRGDQKRSNPAKTGWDRETIRDQTDFWNDDVLMDVMKNGKWVGGAEHWANYDIL